MEIPNSIFRFLREFIVRSNVLTTQYLDIDWT
jgi:hypothetical protein